MYYRCQHCDQPFESTATRPRCPRCLRISVVVPIGAPLDPGAGGAAPHSASTTARQRRGRGRGVPWPLWLGVGMLAAAGVATLTTDFGAVPADERASLAITYAALAGAGLAFALLGFGKWLKQR